MLKDDMALAKEFVLDTSVQKAIELNDHQAISDMARDCLVWKLYGDGDTDVHDEELYHRFINLVTVSSGQILATLPEVAETALIQEVWQSYEEGIYLYDAESDGDFLDWLEKITEFIKDQGKSASQKSDMSFLCQTLFPFLKQKGVSPMSIIGSPSKGRSAVPAFRILYNEMLSGKMEADVVTDKMKEIVDKVADPNVVNSEFTSYLKAQGLKASRFDPYASYDWPQKDGGGLLMVRYESEKARQRIISRMGPLINAEDLHFWTEKVDDITHYAIWAGHAVSVLQKAGIVGLEINREWDGKTDGFIAFAGTPEAATLGTQTLYASGFTARSAGKSVTLTWDSKNEEVPDPFGEQSEFLF
jgi:hypothetical protein